MVGAVWVAFGAFPADLLSVLVYANRTMTTNRWCKVPHAGGWAGACDRWLWCGAAGGHVRCG